LTAEERKNAVDAIPHCFAETPEQQYRKDAERYLSHKLFESIIDRLNNGQLQTDDQSQQPNESGYTPEQLNAITCSGGYVLAVQGGWRGTALEYLEMKKREREAGE